MKLSLVLVVNLLLISTAVAIPSSAERRAKRALARRTIPFERGTLVDETKNATHAVINPATTSGVVETEPPSGTFTAVAATFNIPTATSPPTYGIWIGIGGYDDTETILQSGVDVVVDDGEISTEAWYEWYPDYAYDFDSITVSAGDLVSISIVTSSSTSASIVIEDLTTGVKSSETLSYSSSYALAGLSVEWLVQLYDDDESTLSDTFPPVTFTNATASTSNGESVDPGTIKIGQ